MAEKKTYSARRRLNKAISARVDAQMDWRVRGLEESLETLQRLTTEMATTIAARLNALEAAVMAQRADVPAGTERGE